MGLSAMHRRLSRVYRGKSPFLWPSERTARASQTCLITSFKFLGPPLVHQKRSHDIGCKPAPTPPLLGPNEAFHTGINQQFSIPETPNARTCASAWCCSGPVAQRLIALAAAWCRDHLSFTPLGRSNSQGRALGGARTSFQVSEVIPEPLSFFKFFCLHF